VPGDVGCRRQLAFVYRKQGQDDRWVATLEEQLKQPDYYLDHASVQSEIAKHYMWLKQWEKALPYAEGAAESYSAWGLGCAGHCYEAMQRWEEAEKYYQACSGRYPSIALEWYSFCRRTGKGDLKSARRMAEEAIAKAAHSSDKPNRYDFALYHLLEGQPEMALPEIERALADSQDAQDAIWLALIADQVPDAKKREAALNQAKELATKQKGDQNWARNGVLGVVELLTKDLANGGKGQIDLEAADKLGASWTERDRLVFHYALAQYLNLRSQHGAADRYFKQCMGWPNINARWRTLAGVALLEHGLNPDDYKSELQPKPKAEKAEANQQPNESTAGEAKPQSGQPASPQPKP
jgi:tetratricopeptide (TPR) repeat protein